MAEDINYGKNQKRIIFTDTDHRHVQLVLKLKNDGLLSRMEVSQWRRNR